MSITINTIDAAINGRYLEAKALVQILPGMLLERYEDGVRPHSVEGGIAPPLIAMEDRFVGKDIHIPYEIDDTVYMRYCLPGDTAWLGFFSIATSPLISLPFLISAGNGLVKLALNPPYFDGAIVGQYLEEVWLSEDPPQVMVKVEF